MRKILLFAMLIPVISAYAQKSDCKYQTDDVDKFSKKKILWTKWDNFTKLLGPSALVCGISEGDKKYLGIRLLTSRKLPDKPSKSDLDDALMIPAGSKIILLLADQSTIELKTEKDSKGKSTYDPPKTGNNQTDKYVVNTTTDIFYTLDANSIKIFTTKEINSARVETGNGNFDYEFGKKDHADFLNAIKCVQ